MIVQLPYLSVYCGDEEVFFALNTDISVALRALKSSIWAVLKWIEVPIKL